MNDLGRHDLETPEGRARALDAVAAHLAKVKDLNVRDDYAGVVAHHVRVDRKVVHDAVEGRDISPVFFPDPERPFDRIEEALLRVVLDDPKALEVVTEADFSDERLRHAFLSIEDRRGSGIIDPATVLDPVARSLLIRLAVDEEPLPSRGEILARANERRLDREIAVLQRELASMDEETEAHSAKLRRLIALQQEKRSSTRM